LLVIPAKAGMTSKSDIMMARWLLLAALNSVPIV
jgi:hypothetical protein